MLSLRRHQNPVQPRVCGEWTRPLSASSTVQPRRCGEQRGGWYPIIRESRYKPVSQFIVSNLTQGGVSDLVFVINETKHQLLGYFGNGSRFGCHITYVVQEAPGTQGTSTSPGLAHALDSAYRQVRGKTVYFGMADTIIEPGDVFFMDPAAGRSCFRLGFSSIPQERIEPGIARLARLAQRVRR